MSLWDKIRFWKQRHAESAHPADEHLPPRVRLAIRELAEACKEVRLPYISIIQIGPTTAVTRSAMFGNVPSGLIVKLALDLGLVSEDDLRGTPPAGAASA